MGVFSMFGSMAQGVEESKSNQASIDYMERQSMLDRAERADLEKQYRVGRDRSLRDIFGQTTLNESGQQQYYPGYLSKGFDPGIEEMRGMADQFSGSIDQAWALQKDNVNYRNEAAALMRDPSSVMDRPGVQFEFGQGLKAMQAMQSKGSGGGISGNQLLAAQDYGRNFARDALSREMGLIDAQRGRINEDISGYMSFAQRGDDARLNMIDLMRQKGTAETNVSIGAQTGMQNMTGQLMQNSLQQSRDLSSGFANLNKPTTNWSNIGNQAGKWATWASREYGSDDYDYEEDSRAMERGSSQSGIGSYWSFF